MILGCTQRHLEAILAVMICVTRSSVPKCVVRASVFAEAVTETFRTAVLVTNEGCVMIYLWSCRKGHHPVLRTAERPRVNTEGRRIFCGIQGEIL